MDLLKRVICLFSILFSLTELSFARTNNRHVPLSIAMTTSDNACVGITNETVYTLLLNTSTPGGAYCVNECPGTICDCFLTLSAGASQAVSIPEGAWIYLQYNACLNVSNNTCSGYSGYIGITFKDSQAEINPNDTGTATLGTPVDGYYPLYFTSNNPICPLGTNIPTPQTYSSIPYRGVNMAGCDFEVFTPPVACNAVYFVQQGASTIRLPVLWEYLQPNLTPTTPPAPIDFTTGDALAYSNLVTQLTNAGLYVVIDMHNYMRYNAAAPGRDITNPAYVIGSGLSTALTVDQYVAAWESIALQFVNNSLVMFDLMNEPNNMSTQLILDNYNAVIAAIRNVENTASVDPHLIHLEGNSYSCLGTWTTATGGGYDVANSVVFVPGKIGDPSDNYVIHVHEYFTGNESSTNPTGSCGSGEYDYCISASTVLETENFSAFTDYLATNNLRAFIGELNGAQDTRGAPNSNCAACVNNLLDGVEGAAYNETDGFGFIGWTGWAGGSFPTSYRLNLNPTYNGSTPTQTIQMIEGFNPHMTPL